MRVDKWLWAARFYKTRSLAQQAIAAGQVRVGDERIKPARELRAGDVVRIRKDQVQWTLVVRALSDKRGSAEVARQLYDETAESLAERQRLSDLRRYGAEPAAFLKGRPTKRDRRELERFSGSPGLRDEAE